MNTAQKPAIDALKKALVQPVSAVDSKAWARQIIARKSANERISPTIYAMAQRALGQVG